MPIYKTNSIFQQLDLSLLKHFFAIASFGGFSKASRATGVSQPALSLGLQKIEKTLGTSMVDRKARHFSLTPAGQTLFNFCQRLENSLDTVFNDLATHVDKPRPRLRIGTALSIGISPFVNACLKNASSKDPYEVEFSMQNTYRLIDDLAEGRLDAAMIPTDTYDTRIRLRPHFKDDVALVYGNPLKRIFSKKKPANLHYRLANVSLVTYPRETPMRSLVDKLCLQNGFKFQSVLSVNSVDAVKMLVTRGVGAGFILRSLIEEELNERVLHEFEPLVDSHSSGVMVATAANDRGEEVSKILESLFRK